MYVFNTAYYAPGCNFQPYFAQCSAPETSITNTCSGFDCSIEGQTCNNATDNKYYCCVNKKWVAGKCSGPCKRYSSLAYAQENYNQVSLRSKISAQSNSSAYQSVYIQLCAANTVGRTLPDSGGVQSCVPSTMINLTDYYINPGCLTGKEEICTSGTCSNEDTDFSAILF